MQTLIVVAAIVVVALVGLIAIGLIFSRMYRKATKEEGFVRTGMGGQKVILDGGALVLPVLHETIPINLKTMRLEISRRDKQALITKDKYRADVTAEFFIRVDTKQAAIAAQTLGRKTMKPEELKDLIEGKMVDALRSVASQMNMNEMHEKRSDFVQNVQNTLKEDLDKNGLELESVSLTGLDQTNREHFDENNVFDAEGLTKLTEQIEIRRKQRNEIEKDTENEINKKNFETNKLNLKIAADDRQAQLDQEKEIATNEETQATEVANMRAAKHREQEQARITAEREVQESEIAASQSVEEKKIAKEKDIESRKIQKSKEIEAEQIVKERTIEEENIKKLQAIEIANQNKAISIAEKSKEHSIAQADANVEKEKAVKTDEAVITAKETAKAERDKQISIIKSSEDAEKVAVAETIKAEGQVKVAEAEAKAVKTKAEANAQAELIEAEGKSAAEIKLAEALKATKEAEAAGIELVNKAENSISLEILNFRLRQAAINISPSVVAESVKPLERIEGIKLVQVDGLQAHGNFGSYTGPIDGTGGDEGEGKTRASNLTDQLVNSALHYRAAAPMVDELLKSIGFDGGSIAGLTSHLTNTIKPTAERADDPKPSKKSDAK